MEQELNFSSSNYRRADLSWGGMSSDGLTFYGMVEDARRGAVDLIGTSLTLRTDRARAVEYLPPIGTETYALFIPASGRYLDIKCIKY